MWSWEAIPVLSSIHYVVPSPYRCNKSNLKSIDDVKCGKISDESEYLLSLFETFKFN